MVKLLMRLRVYSPEIKFEDKSKLRVNYSLTETSERV